MRRTDKVLLCVLVLQVAVVSTAAAYDSFIDLFWWIWR
jgi:hypothetical protein